MLEIDPRDHTPIYLQIAAQVTAAAERGTLVPGAPLPSIRAVARALEISPNTVLQAYSELVRAGVAEVRRGRGTFVAERGGPAGKAGRAAAVAREAIDRLVALGLSPGEAADLVAREARARRTRR